MHRLLTVRQWASIFVVFLGLCLTAWSNPSQSKQSVQVAWGTICILVGSCMHGGFYVMSDAIMQPVNEATRRHFLYPREITALQSAVACSCLGLWQIFYTVPRWKQLIQTPLEDAATTNWEASMLLLSFAGANTVHASTFYFTIANYPGGSTSAGVFKGLQAVLVFVAAHWMFCGADRPEMCWSLSKMVSLVLVVCGVSVYNIEQRNKPKTAPNVTSSWIQYDSISTASV